MQNHNYIPVYQNTMRMKLITSETGFVNLFDGTSLTGQVNDVPSRGPNSQI